MTQTPSVEEFLSGYPPRIRGMANTLRRLIREATPGVQESYYPGWKLVGYRVLHDRKSYYFGFIAPFVDHVQLGFEFGNMLTSHPEMLERRGKRVSTIRISDRKDIVPKKITDLISEAALIAASRPGAVRGGGK